MIAAALSIQRSCANGPRIRSTRPTRAAPALRRARAPTCCRSSPCGTTCATQQRALSGNQFRRLCRDEYLNYLRVREWQDLFSQLRQVAGDLGIRPSDDAGPPRPRPPRRARRAALAHRDARRRQPGAAAAPAGRRSRSLAARCSPATCAALGDGRRARRDEPAVGAAGGGDRAGVGRATRRRTSCDGRTASRGGTPQRAAAVTAETVTLYGLPIVSGRTVRSTASTGRLAGEMFIRHALVGGDWSDARHAFVAHNAALRRAGRRARGAGAARRPCSTTRR